MLKQPMNWRWHLAIGAFSFVSLIILYSIGSARLERQRLAELMAEAELDGSREKLEKQLAENPHHDKLVTMMPSWGRLFEKGWKEVTKKNSKGNDLLIVDVGARIFAGDERAVRDSKRVADRVKAGQDVSAAALERGRKVQAEIKTDRDREVTDAEQIDLDLLNDLEKVPQLMDLAEDDRLAKVTSVAERKPSGLYDSFLVIKSSRFTADMRATLVRFLKGLGLSILIALPLGLLMGCYAPLEAYFQPLMAFVAKIPATLLYGVFLILPLIGGTDHMYSAMIVFGVAPTLTITVYLAAKFDVHEELLYKARTLGASEIECIYDVIFKLVFPRFLDGVRLAVGPALIFLFAVELLRAEVGIGGAIRVNLNKGMSAIPVNYLYIFIAALIGLAIDSGLRWFQRKMCPWFTK